MVAKVCLLSWLYLMGFCFWYLQTLHGEGAISPFLPLYLDSLAKWKLSPLLVTLRGSKLGSVFVCLAGAWMAIEFSKRWRDPVSNKESKAVPYFELVLGLRTFPVSPESLFHHVLFRICRGSAKIWERENNWNCRSFQNLFRHGKEMILRPWEMSSLCHK